MAGRQQTTKGIWLAASSKVSEPVTLVMDLEGCDGRERGEDDTSFERQSALFALATADVVLINMWAKDIGRESGAGKPLLKTVFQVNLKLFTPAPGKRKAVLLFVFRDRTRTPLERLVEVWEADLERMWGAIAKPPAYAALPLSAFFDVRYAALCNFEEREEEFRAEALLLRRRFAAEGALAGCLGGAALCTLCAVAVPLLSAVAVRVPSPCSDSQLSPPPPAHSPPTPRLPAQMPRARTAWCACRTRTSCRGTPWA